MTAREIAKDFIRPYVLRGDSLLTLRCCQGYMSKGVDVQIGGSYSDPTTGKGHRVDLDHIVVSETEDGPCCVLFRLAEIYAEVQGELRTGARQMELFEEQPN